MMNRIFSMAVIWLLIVFAGHAVANDYFKKERLLFSTEEDFIGIDENGNPRIVSDGDVLGWYGEVVMKNRELTRAFDEKNDLGLDALDVVDMENRLLVFSTERSSSKGLFTDGDLLSSRGARIPNRALSARFKFPYAPGDLGLDAVQVRGPMPAIVKFLEMAVSKGHRAYEDDPEQLPRDLEKFGLDIWFSTDGTAPYSNYPMFYDGDLLSVVQGTVVVMHEDLLPFVAPAGLPKRGADFGLDAFMCPRLDKEPLFFSTEILFNNDTFHFTDGDLLMAGVVGVIISNLDFIDNFSPQVDFLGLDAVSYFEK